MSSTLTRRAGCLGLIIDEPGSVFFNRLDTSHGKLLLSHPVVIHVMLHNVH